MGNYFALVDCDNFYVSCERIFNPKLARRAVVILSNNDGCVISRSAEAKALGIGMGAPLFRVRGLVESNGVEVFSSNYALYADMSRRVMETLSTLASEVEVYSIDEAFVGLRGDGEGDLREMGSAMRERLRKWTGVPVSVGIAPTKTLAKVAARVAKRKLEAGGVFCLEGEEATREVLAATAVDEVWGIGPSRARLLRSVGVETALDLSRMDERRARRSLSVVGARIVRELRGDSCLPLESCPRPRRSITASRSFGRAVETRDEMCEAAAFFVSKAAERLRREKMAARVLVVFMMTNRFEPETFHESSAVVNLPVPTDLTPELIGYAREAVCRAFGEGQSYRKAGVMLLDLVSARPAQGGLFDARDRERAGRVMQTVDRINALMGPGTLRFARAGSGGAWQPRAERRSPRYTTCWRELLTLAPA